MSEADAETGSDDDAGEQPHYVSINVICPVCGSTEFTSTMEDVPNEFETHKVNPTCADCGTILTIVYRAIDITWYDEYDGFHSAVSQGAIVPKKYEYPDHQEYAELRRSVDYWYMASKDGETWEPLASETDALARLLDDEYEVHIARPSVMRP